MTSEVSRDGQQRAERLHDAGKRPVEKRTALGETVRNQRCGDHRAFGEVLNRDADGQRQRAGSGDDSAALQHPGENDADRHSFGDVVQRDGEDEP